MTVEIITGMLMPPIIDVVNRKISSSTLRYIISLVVCILVGVLMNWGEISLENILQSGAIVFASAQSTHKIYWSGSSVRAKFVK